MNTGIGDAVDLGWKLAATLKGFAGPGLLASYEAERRPVGYRNRLASERHTGVRIKIGELYERISDPDVLAREIAALGNAENESWGIEFGYRYDGVEPDPVKYEPTTAPGARLPSTFLRDGSALYDRLGPWFTLLVFGNADPSPLIDAAPAPLDTVMVDDPVAPIYEARLVLVRPDTHVAWRGNGCADGRAVWRQVGEKTLPRLFKNIFLMAADEDADAFEDSAKLARLPELAEAVHVYFARNDLALTISDKTKAQPDRLGSTGPRTLTSLPHKVVLVDCTDVSETASITDARHQYYRRRDEVIADVRQVIAGKTPESIDGRKWIPERRCFMIKKQG